MFSTSLEGAWERKPIWLYTISQVCKAIQLTQSKPTGFASRENINIFITALDSWHINANEPCLISKELSPHKRQVSQYYIRKLDSSRGKVWAQVSCSYFFDQVPWEIQHCKHKLGDSRQIMLCWEQYRIRNRMWEGAVERIVMINLNHVMSSRSLDYYREIRLE